MHGEGKTVKNKKTQLKGVLMLLLTALVWGSSFVAQSVGMEQVDAFTFNGIRTLMGAAVLLPFIVVRDRLQTRKMTAQQRLEQKKANKRVMRYGCILGAVFCAASNLQQFAFYDSTAGKIAFITALYMFFVPLLGLFLGKKVPWMTWLCVLTGFVGLGFLCIDPCQASAINKGDLLTLLCAVFYAVHILLIERFVAHEDGLKLSCVQFAVSGTISCILMFVFEQPRWEAVQAALVPLLYSGVMSCGLAYTFQILGQKYTEATLASLIMCLEPVFGVLSAALILQQTLSGREILGCVLMFAAIIVLQLWEGFLAKKATFAEQKQKNT